MNTSERVYPEFLVPARKNLGMNLIGIEKRAEYELALSIFSLGRQAMEKIWHLHIETSKSLVFGFKSMLRMFRTGCHSISIVKSKDCARKGTNM